MKELNEQTEKNKLLEEQQKLLKQRNEQNKILEQQNDEQKKLLEEQKKLVEEEEENMLRDIIPSPSKISDLITKSLETQGVAAGEQAGIAIMENKLETSKNHIEYLKKELRNTDFSSEKALEISNKIIKEEDEVCKLEKEIREREEDIERRFRKYYPDKYYPDKKCLEKSKLKY